MEDKMLDHAKALQKHCDKYYNDEECVGCVFADGQWCKLYSDRPKHWKLEKEPKLSETEIDILRFWKKQGGVEIRFMGNEYTVFNERGNYISRSYGINNFEKLKGNKAYKIDDLLKGEE